MTQRNDTPASGPLSPSPPDAPVDPAAIRTSAPPASSTGIQTAPDAAPSDRVALPPPAPEPKRIVDPKWARWRAMAVDCVQVLLVLALAFLSAAFPIRNSDLFMHMGTGKLLVEGKYTFGTDPFSVNPPDAAWVNHSWLFDLWSYGLFLAAGEGAEGLVILKAILMVALAGVMLLIRRAGQPLWIPAVCTALAVLAVSTRMLYQPMILSYLFLALTIFILSLRSTHPPATGKVGEKPSFLASFGARPYRLYTLPILFALWANIDAWFILGPITVGLYLLGEVLQETLNPVPRGPDAPVQGEGRRLIVVLILGVAACLLNPHHFRVFEIPTEISPWLAPEIRGDKQFGQIFWSPWQGEYFSRAEVYHSLASMAYYLLLAVSFISFLVNAGSWRWWRALTWAAFAALSAYHARSIPIFAIVAGPIMVLNFQDALLATRTRKRAAPAPARTSAWPFAGRVLSALLLTILVAAAWPGWLHGFPDDPVAERYRVGFNLDADVSLVKTAQQLAEWRREGTITGEQNAFNLHPDVANYLAFYCPEEKTYFDHRFALHKDTASAYYQMRNELTPPRGDDGATQQLASRSRVASDWRTEFRAHNVRHLLVYDPDQRRVFPVIEQIHNEMHQQEKNDLREKRNTPEVKAASGVFREWTLIDQRGRVALFAWSDPDKTWDDSLHALEKKPNEQAFGPNALRAPGASAGRGPASVDDDILRDFQEWWEKFANRRPLRTPESYEAGYHWHVSNVKTQQARNDLSTKHATQIAAAIGFGTGAQTLPGECLFRMTHWGQALIGPTEKFGSSASSLLAIRAARRALAADPFDDAAYDWLGAAYLQLPECSNPIDLFSSGSLLSEIRRCQIMGCLYNAAKIQPDRLGAHHLLGELYLLQGIADLGLQQKKEELRVIEELGPKNLGEDKEVYSQRLTRLRDQIKLLDEHVKNTQNDFLIATKNVPKVVLKAQLAEKRGLAGEAIDLLVKTSPVELGADGLLMELRLLLAVGRVEDVRANWKEELTDNPQFVIVGPYQLPIFKWLLVLQSMTVGDYDKADEALEQMIATVERVHRVILPRGLTPDICAQSMDFLDPTGLRPLTWQCFQRYDRFLRLQQLKRLPPISPAQAELHVLRGLLALEIGDSRRAAEQFRTGLNLSWPPRRYVPYLSLLGTSNPFEAAAAAAEDLEVAQGVILPVPTRWLAVEYLRLIEAAAKSPSD